MRIDFQDPPPKEYGVWKEWYAWHPVLTRKRNGKRSLVWLMPVMRLLTWDGWVYAVPGE